MLMAITVYIDVLMVTFNGYEFLHLCVNGDINGHTFLHHIYHGHDIKSHQF